MRVSEVRVGTLLYFVGVEHVYVLVLDQLGQSQVFQLARLDTLFPLIDEFLEAMERAYSPKGTSVVFGKFSFEWGRLLLPPASSLQKFDVLVLIPHNTVHGLPIHAVWLEDRKQFLATAFGITYCSSAALFTRCVDRNQARNFDLSAWEFSLDGSSAASTQAPQSCVSFGADIKYDKTEQYHALAAEFGKHFPVSVDASEEPRFSIKNSASDAICVVCHGYYDLTRPGDSGLLLERDPAGVSRRPITLYNGAINRGLTYSFRDLPLKPVPLEIEPNSQLEVELMTINELKVNCYIEAQLVALLGCSTGAGHVMSGDDFNTMGYQWLKVGAASVLSSFWELDLEFAKVWVQRFLDNWLVKRQPKAIAFRQTLKEIQSAHPKLEPYDWGVIVLLGDWV